MEKRMQTNMDCGCNLALAFGLLWQWAVGSGQWADVDADDKVWVLVERLLQL